MLVGPWNCFLILSITLVHPVVLLVPGVGLDVVEMKQSTRQYTSHSNSSSPWDFSCPLARPYSQQSSFSALSHTTLPPILSNSHNALLLRTSPKLHFKFPSGFHMKLAVAMSQSLSGPHQLWQCVGCFFFKCFFSLVRRVLHLLDFPPSCCLLGCSYWAALDYSSWSSTFYLYHLL